MFEVKSAEYNHASGPDALLLCNFLPPAARNQLFMKFGNFFVFNRLDYLSEFLRVRQLIEILTLLEGVTVFHQS